MVKRDIPMLGDTPDGEMFLQARIAELEAEVERTNAGWDHTSKMLGASNSRAYEAEKALTEALSRTGAVKVKALAWSVHPAGGEQALGAGLGLYRVHANGDDWYLVPDHMGTGGKAAAQADYERRILSALEPAAPEAQQEPVAWRWRPRDGDVWVHWGSKPKTGENLVEDAVVEIEPLFTRPSEQAVTGALIDQVLDAAGDYMGVQYGNTALHHPIDRERVKAAVEARR